jgi:hypothetical protein
MAPERGDRRRAAAMVCIAFERETARTVRFGVCA